MFLERMKRLFRDEKPFWEKYRTRGPRDEAGFLKLTQRYLDEVAIIPGHLLRRYDGCAEDYIRPTGIHKIITIEGVEEHERLALLYLKAIAARGFNSCMDESGVKSAHETIRANILSNA